MAILPPSRDTHHTNCNIVNGPDLKPRLKLIPCEFPSFTISLPCSTHPHTKHTTMLQDQPKSDFSGIRSHHFDSLLDSNTSPQSTFSSTLSSIQGSPEGSSSASSPSYSSQEPSPTGHEFCWESDYDTMKMLEKMKLDERDSSEYHPGYVNQRLETSNVGLHSLLQEQIRAIQLSGIRQEEILSQKQDPTAYVGKTQRQISQQFEKKGKGVNVGYDYERRIRPPWQQGRSHQQTGSRGSSYSGTGVFLPRGETSAPLESRKRPGKGCTAVLIPARVVQALQVHFDQMAATCGPTKPSAFPPLHDVLVSTSDGMYSLQNRQSQNQQQHMQNEMLLPQEWTY
ncbi:hypothetical protein VIGAN_06204300 [Vigna angularis var. angularis]|uniref:Uncharacterized protein n=1 Tax=Vigna angularis var. angularis TaxID=157739 RepID=A0A0S3SD29_PHAAN|nr:uncharacterized protein LOC108319606 isoform X1 [Vigna angularis]BAT90760.1 hypothetical protein VIGAN_06204300 [Vigna angularis var. angularis]